MGHVADFIRSKCIRVPGCKVKFTTFYEEFQRFLPADDRPRWNKMRVINELAKLGFDRGQVCSQVHIANIALPTMKYTRVDGKLRKEPL